MKTNVSSISFFFYLFLFFISCFAKLDFFFKASKERFKKKKDSYFRGDFI